MMWYSLPQGHIDKAVKMFPKRMKACVEVEGGHFTCLQSLHNSDALLDHLNDVILLCLLECFSMR